MTVLIFRPADKITQTIREFDDAGIQAVGIPLVENQVLSQGINNLKDLLTHQQNNKVVFISTTASQLAVEQLDYFTGNLRFYAVGKSTADILRKSGLEVTVPADESSEGLLSLSDFQDVTGESIIIIKGEGGRQTLAETLEKRAANVKEVAVYRRSIISQPKATRDWNAADISCIIATSGEIVSAAFAQFDAKWLQATPWIVVSERVKSLACEKGAQTVLTSEGAQSHKLIAATKRFLEQ